MQLRAGVGDRPLPNQRLRSIKSTSNVVVKPFDSDALVSEPESLLF